MEVYYTFSILVVIATIFAYINKLYLKLPSTIGVMVIAMVCSLIIVFLGEFLGESYIDKFSNLLKGIDFSKILMGGMLSFLLFAGAIHINLDDLKEQKIPIMVFSSLSVILSTAIVGFILYWVLNMVMPAVDLHVEIPLLYCLLFGALISPTDPIAVLAILKEAKVSKNLETKVAGESLFNDGVAVVVFSVLLGMTQMSSDGEMNITVSSVSLLFAKEVFGGIALGLALGHLAWHGMRRALDLKISVLITLSVVMGGYMIASVLHVSGPLAMVVAGIYIGAWRKKGFSNKKIVTNNLNIFWELIDEVFNAILFLFIGFELLIIPNLVDYWQIGIISIFVVLLARYLSIKIPTVLIPFKEKFSRGSIIILVWGGLRGGVSIALALSIPENPYKQIILAATYFVVVFSIIIQGLTIAKVAKKIEIEE